MHTNVISNIVRKQCDTLIEGIRCHWRYRFELIDMGPASVDGALLYRSPSHKDVALEIRYAIKRPDSEHLLATLGRLHVFEIPVFGQCLNQLQKTELSRDLQILWNEIGHKASDFSRTEIRRLFFSATLDARVHESSVLFNDIIGNVANALRGEVIWADSSVSVPAELIELIPAETSEEARLLFGDRVEVEIVLDDALHESEVLALIDSHLSVCPQAGSLTVRSGVRYSTGFGGYVSIRGRQA